MRRDRGKAKATGRGGAQGAHPAQGPVDRANSLLLRLETGGPNPVNAAEELDRLQGRLQRDDRLDALRPRIADLCAAWAGTPLRGERGRAWLTLVGAFGLKEHAGHTADLAREPGLPPALRMHACRVLPVLGGEDAGLALQAVLLANTDAQVRAAAAEALADLGDRSAAPILQALLEEDLPRGLWSAVSAAADRLR